MFTALLGHKATLLPSPKLNRCSYLFTDGRKSFQSALRSIYKQQRGPPHIPNNGFNNPRDHLRCSWAGLKEI